MADFEFSSVANRADAAAAPGFERRCGVACPASISKRASANTGA
jgi:hypothetical protein